MAGRGPQSFKKRQKEQQRKERQQMKAEKRLQRRKEGEGGLESMDAESGPADGTVSIDEEELDALVERLVP